MADLSAKDLCPDCGLPISRDLGGGFCPRCALQLALSSQDAVSNGSKLSHPPGLPSRFFGDYEILGEIARGGMGVVYRARQLGLKRTVALKMVQAHHLLSDEASLRLRVEIEAVALLNHPNIVSLYESGEHDGVHYFTMRLIEGGDLLAYLGRQPTLRALIGMMVKVCRAVHYAHQRGILHRDLKPSNILVDLEGEPHVADFGLAKSLDQDTGFTFTSTVLGSPNYMAPEQASGKGFALTTAVDVYGLGAILYHILAGRPPFQAANPIDTLRQVVDFEPAPPRSFHPDTDPDLETVALKCLRKNPSERYGSAEDLALDLERWLRREPILARPLGAFETAYRWSRRHPALVLLGFTLSIALSLLVGGSVFAAWRIRAANQRTEALVTRMQVQKAEDYFSQGETSKGLATLAHVLRREPQHTAATLRLRSALEHRRYAQPRSSPFYHGAPIRAFTLLPDQRRLASVTESGKILAWDLQEGIPLGTWHEFARPVKIAAISENGEQLLIGFRDGGLQLRRLGDSGAGHDLHALGEGAVALALSPSGAKAASASVQLAPQLRHSVEMWDTLTGAPLGPERPHDLLVTDVQFTRDEKHLVTACADGRIRFWPVDGKAKDPSLVLIQPACLLLRFDPSGRWMAVGEYEGGIKVWDLQDLSRPRWSFQHPRRILNLKFNATGTLLLSSSADDSAQVWDLSSGGAKGPSLRHGNIVNEARFSPDETIIATASNDNTVRLWDAATGEPLTEHLPHESGVQSVTFASSPEPRLITTTFSGTVTLWELRPAILPTLRIQHPSAVVSVQFSPDASALLSGGADGEVRLTDLTSLKTVGRWKMAGAVNAVAFSPDGKQFAVGGADRLAHRFDSLRCQPIGEPLLHEFAIERLQFDASGPFLLVMEQMQAKVWNLTNGLQVGKTMKHQDFIEIARLSPSGRQIITASRDRTVQRWSAFTGEAMGPPVLSGDLAVDAEFSPDEKELLIATRSHQAALLSLDPKPMVMHRLVHRAPVSRVGFHPGGKLMVTSSDDQNVRIWNPSLSPEPLHTLAHSTRVLSAEFSSDGRRVLSLAADGVVRLWDTESGLLIADPIHLPGATVAIMSRDGRKIALCSKSGTILVRSVEALSPRSPASLIAEAERVAQQVLVSPDRFVPWRAEEKTSRR